jgi:8-oxo-dGTP diphosphatase
MKSTRAAAAVVILNKEDHVLLLKRPAWIGWGPNKWAYPGGKLEKGESPEEAATRETFEETQLVVSSLKPLPIEIEPHLTFYYTRNYKGKVEIDWEHVDWAWVPPAELGDYDLAPDVSRLYDWVIQNDG